MIGRSRLRAKPEQLSYERLAALLTWRVYDERCAGGRKVGDGTKKLSVSGGQ